MKDPTSKNAGRDKALVAPSSRVTVVHDELGGARRTIRSARAAFAVIVSFAATVAFAIPASAHTGEATTKASLLVRQAIALIVNTPRNEMAIEDKIKDALDSNDTAGVTLDLVAQAQKTLASGDLHATRTLLERSIGARPHLSPAMPVAIGSTPAAQPATMPGTVIDTPNGPMQMAVGDQTGSGVAEDPLSVSTDLSGRELGALIVSIVAIAGGVVLAIRFRPPISLRQLRARAVEGGGVS